MMCSLKYFLALVLVFLAFSGCAKGEVEMKDTLTRILETKTLRVGTDATYPLFETKDAGGNLVGFDIDLMNGLCEEMGVKAEFVVVPFDGIIPGLENEKYDAIISAMTITPKRGERVNFTQPYYFSGQSIAVREEEERIKGVEDLIGKKIGVQLATTGEMEAKKIEGAEVVSFDDILMAFTDLKNGNVDAVINDVPVSQKILSMKKGMKIVGPLLTNESYGIAVRKEDSKLLVAINKALESHKKKGKYEKLEEKWFGGNYERQGSLMEDRENEALKIQQLQKQIVELKAQLEQYQRVSSSIEEKPTEYFFNVYGLNRDGVRKEVHFCVAISESFPLLEKLKQLAKFLSRVRFGHLPLEVLRIKEQEDKKIAIIGLSEQDGHSPSWNGHFFEGSLGGMSTTFTLIWTFLQEDYPGEWIDAVEFYYEGKPIGLWDHVKLSGTKFREEKQK